MTAHNRRDALRHMIIGGLALSHMPLLSNLDKGSNPSVEHEHETFYIPAAPPLEPGPDGIDIRVLVRSAQTHGQYSCVECAVAPRKMGPAPHVHENLDELCYVLEGTASVLVGDKVFNIEAGGWHMRPRRVPHTFWNGTDKPLRFIDMYFNQDFELYLEEVFHDILPMVKAKHKKFSDPDIVARFDKLQIKYGLNMFHDQRQAIIDKYNLVS